MRELTKKSKELLKTLISLKTFENAIENLISESEKAKVEDLISLIRFIPPKDHFSFICFMKACDRREIKAVKDLKDISMPDKIILMAEFVKVLQSEEELKLKS